MNKSESILSTEAKPGTSQASPQDLINGGRAGETSLSPSREESGQIPAIEAVNVTKVFPTRKPFLKPTAKVEDKVAVDDVSLTIGQGEIFGLIGPNGAGKTTLIKMLCTLLRPTSGTIRLTGLDVVKQEHKVRKLVGLVASNERSFYWRLTGRQNLDFFAAIYKLPEKEAHAWMEEMYDYLDLRSIIDMRFDHYSTGQKQRLAIARGLLSKPKILLMDEPTKGVDPIGSAKLISIIRERLIQLWHPTILITSHNLTEIERLCKRVALMAQGKLIAVGELEKLRGMVRPVDTYRLRTRHVSMEKVKEIAEKCQDFQIIRFNSENGALEIEVSFLQESEGFSMFITGLVKAGGQILTCTSIQATFDDVFHALIAERGISTIQD